MFNQLNPIQAKRFFNAILTVIILLAVFIGVKSINALKESRFIGSGTIASNIISVTGTGEVLAIPDTGTFSFSVVETGKTVGEAQDKASKKINASIDALKSLGIDEKDIKTTGYNSYPKYDYRQSVCPMIPMDAGAAGVTVSPTSPYYCPPNKQVLIGYEVSQSITVKIRKTEDAGAIVTKVGSLGVSNISGLDFVIDDIDTVQAEARDMAIQDAKAKAKVLAKSLGVRLVKIVNFEEGNRGGPIYYATSMEGKAMDTTPAPVPPQTPVGQDKIVSNVTITYEID